MNLIDKKIIQSWRSLLDSDPDYRRGWDDFSARLSNDFPRCMEEIDARRRDYAAREVTGFTHMNFIRSAAAEASRLAFHAARTGSASSRESALTMMGWLEGVKEWRAQGFKNGWRSDLWTADIATGFALALDQLAGGLESSELSRLRRVLLERGVLPVLEEWVDPEKRIHALDSMGHNWWTVCVAGATIGLFAAAEEEPRANEWFDLIADSIIEFFAYPGNVLQNKQPTFGAQGDFIESIGYLDYTLHNLVLVFDLYREHLGRDLAAEIPILPAVCDYYMACVQPLRSGVQRLNFGDMGSGRETVGAYNHNPAPVWLWMADRFGREDLFHLVRRTHPHPTDVLDFLFWPEKLRGESFAGAPGDEVFRNIGVAVLRDGYSDDATVLAVKTGEKWNHNQSDAGSFILSAQGVEFFIDPGTTEYSNPLHRSYFKSSKAHNVVLHDGRGQVDDLDDLGTKFMGRIASHLFAPGYRYVLADATGPWEGVYRRYYRHILWLGDVVVMVDDLMAWQEGDWTALFHHAGQAELRDGGFTVRNGGLALEATFIDPMPLEVGIETGYRSCMVPDDFKYRYKVDEQPYLSARYAAAGLRRKIITLFELPGAAPRERQRLIGEHYSGVRLSGGDRTTEVLCNHRADGSVMHHNSHLTMEDVATDGFLTVIERDRSGRIAGAGLHNAGSLRVDGRLCYSSLLKSDAFVDFKAGDPVLHTRLSAETFVTMDGAKPGTTMRRRVPAGTSITRFSP